VIDWWNAVSLTGWDLVFAVVVLAAAAAPLCFRADLLSLALGAGLTALGAALPLFPGHLVARCVAVGPAAIYLLVLGGVNLARRPRVVSGVRDTAALALAVAGLVMVGPGELFFPVAASIRLGAMVWGLLGSLYLLGVVLFLLVMRPRLVIYNVSTDELRPVLAEVLSKIDPDARWAQDSLYLPGLGIQFHVESLARLRNVALIASGPLQNYQGWRRLETALSAALVRVEVPRNYGAMGLLSAGVILLAFVVMTVSRDPQAVAAAFREAIAF
jgi:hypothetical protein